MTTPPIPTDLSQAVERLTKDVNTDFASVYYLDSFSRQKDIRLVLDALEEARRALKAWDEMTITIAKEHAELVLRTVSNNPAYLNDPNIQQLVNIASAHIVNPPTP